MTARVTALVAAVTVGLGGQYISNWLESDRLLKRLFDYSNDGLVLLDPKTAKIIGANHRASEFLGYTIEELHNLNLVDIHPHDYSLAEAFISSVTCAGFGNSDQVACMKKDGGLLPADVSATVIPHRGNKYVLVAIRDITERKRAEKEAAESRAKLEEVFSIAPEAIITANADMTIQLFNKGAERIFGYTGAEILGKSIETLMPENLRANHQEHVNEFDRSERVHLLMDGRQDVIGLRKDGSIFPAAASISKLETGGEKMYTVVLQDITQRKQAEEDVHHALAEAEQANQAKSEFLATMSHELRTPLNAISGFSVMMMSEIFGTLGSSRYKEYATDIHTSSEHLLQLVNDILDLSTIEAGEHHLSRENLNANGVIEDCWPVIAASANDKNITYSAEMPENPVMLFVDRRALKQVLFNILDNAVKFTPQGGRITLRLFTSDDRCNLEVRDTGEGIPANRLPGITDPFVRTESDPHKAQIGTGLGLAIVKSLVELHNGELVIDSEVGKGTVVTVALPNYPSASSVHRGSHAVTN